MPDDPRRCKHAAICGLPAHAKSADDSYCILHLPPAPPKDASRFAEALRAYLERGGSDFRWMYFLEGWASFEGRHFASTLDFRDATVFGMLTLTGATCDESVVLGGAGIQNVDLSGATVTGDLTYSGRIGNTFRLQGATILGATLLRFDTSAHVQGYKARFHRNVVIDVAADSILLGLEMGGTTVRDGLTIRGSKCGSPHGKIDFAGATLSGYLAFAGVDFDGPLAFPEVTFSEDCTLDLRGARVRGAFTLTDLGLGPKTVFPSRILIDGTRFDEAVRIDAPPRGQKPRLVASGRRPVLERGATLANVDVTECLLAGNAVEEIRFWNVEWRRRRWRYVLADEVVGVEVPPSTLREAYQVLKQRYQGKGDHVRAGDFHYGEMEMKRREYGWPKRWISWEFVYWALSGYGIGHVRSLAILLVLITGFGAAYHFTKPDAFTGGLWEALRYSVGVAALQRPDMPKQFGEPQKWLHVAEAIFGPVQIALFALALRRRLMR